ncbi:hypothetical protein ALC53_00850 [Atta colombica]|uniref:Uncharacterized protein n=2 Tax=Atta colombica TaxID=520822 RepID=A0A195BVU5_9HYME|nr:hypothetical protein ALC53_00850 [Atta colombica]
MHTWPHFASHTKSSLMKTRTPMKLKKLSVKNKNDSKSQKSIVPKSKGIYKKRSITKQSKSMQMLVMILKQKDRHSNFFLPGGELTETTCQLENSLISLQDNLIKDVSHNFKNCIASPAKLTTLRNKRTKVMNEFGFFAENLHNSSQDGTNCAGRNKSDDTHGASEARTVIDVACKLQLHLSDEEELTDSCSKVEDLHRRIECEKKPDDFSNKDCTEIQVHPQGINIRKRMQKTWMLKKARTQNEHVNVDRCTNLQKSETTQNIGTIVNNDAIIRKRDAPKKNLIFNQRAWRPAGVPKNSTKSTMSLQPMSQKSSQLAEKPLISTKSKHLSTDCIESFNNESTSTSKNQSKILMKENRDPHANHVTKMFDHLAEMKQQQRLQNGGMLSKKKRSRTKIPSKVLDKCDDTKPTLAKSKSRHCQTRTIIPDESSNNFKQRTKSTLTYSKSRTSEVIHTLRKIIDSVRENDNAEENVKKNDDIDHEKNDNNKIHMSPNSDTLQNDELHPAQDINLDELRSSRRSISTQVKLDSPSYHEIDAEKDQDLMEILNLTRIVATQTLPNYIRNVVDVGCNTSAIICNDVEVSCDLIGSTDLTEIESTMIENKLMSNVHTESSSIKHIEVNIENEDINENKKLLLSECKEILNMRLENYDSIEIPANDAAREIEKFMREEVYRIFLKSFKNFDDKTNVDIDEKQEYTKCSSNHNVSNISINNLFSEKSQSSICNYNTSCSSEDIMEYLENNNQQDVFMSESKVEDLTSDVIATFELAADRARNLHEAVIIYHKNLMSKESGKRNEEMIEDYEMSEFRDEQNCFEGYTSFISRENENKIRSECDAICHFVNNEDFGFSTCSSRSSSSDRTCRTKFVRSKDENYVGMEREEENVKSMIQLMHRTQENYALELLESDKSDESFEMEQIKNDKILALPAATKKTCFISHKYLLSFFYCIVYTVVFWYLQYSFQCDSTK